MLIKQQFYYHLLHQSKIFPIKLQNKTKQNKKTLILCKDAEFSAEISRKQENKKTKKQTKQKKQKRNNSKNKY